MMRTILLTIYGICVGAAYAAVLHTALSNEPISTAVLALVLILLFGSLGYGAAKNSEFSNIQSLAFTPLFPILLLGAAIGMVVVLLGLVVLLPFFAVEEIRRVRRFRNEMKSKGRFVTLTDLRPRLNAGEGTLIEETGHKGPYHIWWTEDDLFSLGKAPSTDEELFAILTRKETHAFNSLCLKEYLDDETGKALLTSIPPRYVASGRLARLFPDVRIAMLVRPFGPPTRESLDEH